MEEPNDKSDLVLKKTVGIYLVTDIAVDSPAISVILRLGPPGKWVQLMDCCKRDNITSPSLAGTQTYL